MFVLFAKSSVSNERCQDRSASVASGELFAATLGSPIIWLRVKRLGSPIGAVSRWASCVAILCIMRYGILQTFAAIVVFRILCCFRCAVGMVMFGNHMSLDRDNDVDGLLRLERSLRGSATALTREIVQVEEVPPGTSLMTGVRCFQMPTGRNCASASTSL